MCQRGDKRSVLQSDRMEAFALAANVNPNNSSSYPIHSEASVYASPPHLPQRIHPQLAALVPFEQRLLDRTLIRALWRLHIPR